MADPSPTTAATVDYRPTNSAEYSDSLSGETGVWPAIESYKREEWSLFIYPHVNTEITCSAMLQKLCPTYKIGGGLAPPPPTMTKTRHNGPSTYCEYLNELSALVAPGPSVGAEVLTGRLADRLVRVVSQVGWRTLGATALFQHNDAPYTIQFRSKETKGLPLHAMGTLCHPDIVGVREYPASTSRTHSDYIHWSHLEATGEEHSGKPRKEGEAQPGVYTEYHLQARPDLVSAVGIFVAVSKFQLFFSNPSRVYHTPAIEWTHPDARKLLYAWMWRVYHPELDHSITINMTRNPTFTVTTIDNETYTSLGILRAGESVGRRTIVLARHKPQPQRQTSSSSSCIVIKEQYIENGRRFREGAILNEIHRGGRFPGVVRLGHSEQVMHDGHPISVKYETKKKKKVTTVTRSKTRLVLKDKGTRLAGVKTPREFLTAIYDLLEISRIMYRECKILHRDISPENVLVVDSPTVATEPLRDNLSDMCFSEYLLNKSAAQDGSKSGDRRPRLATKVVLIDFDVSEDQGPRDPSLGDPKARTGTPTFMARVVRSSTYPEGLARLPAMPAIAPELLARYQSIFGTRLEEFPTDEDELIEIPPESTVPPNKFRHLLRYDAESVFWFVLWWCMQAQPAKGSPEEQIPHADWSNLISEPDTRDANFIKVFRQRYFHSAYVELFALLDDMRKHLSGDLEFSKHKERKENPEYMHEVFQRLILNFLVVNENKPFIKLKKSDKPRRVEPGGMSRTRSTQPSKRLLEDPEDRSKSKTKKQRRR